MKKDLKVNMIIRMTIAKKGISVLRESSSMKEGTGDLLHHQINTKTENNTKKSTINLQVNVKDIKEKTTDNPEGEVPHNNI